MLECNPSLWGDENCSQGVILKRQGLADCIFTSVIHCGSFSIPVVGYIRAIGAAKIFCDTSGRNSLLT
jgi:hypothetical protein